MIESRHTLGERVKELRREQQLSQTQLALMVGLDRSYISRIERGKCNPTVESIIIIANGLGIPPAVLFEGVGVPATKSEPRIPVVPAKNRNRTYSTGRF